MPPSSAWPTTRKIPAPLILRPRASFSSRRQGFTPPLMHFGPRGLRTRAAGPQDRPGTLPRVSARWKSRWRQQPGTPGRSSLVPLPPANTVLGSGGDSQSAGIRHVSLCRFFWLERGDLGGNVLTPGRSTQQHGCPCALRSPSHRLEPGLTALPEANATPGVHPQPRTPGCATAPASAACPVPGPPPSGPHHSRPRAAQGKQLFSAADRDDSSPKPSSSLPPSVPIAAGRAQPRWLRLRAHLPHPPLSPEHQAREGGNCLRSLQEGGRSPLSRGQQSLPRLPATHDGAGKSSTLRGTSSSSTNVSGQ